jgi:hypothetical protein
MAKARGFPMLPESQEANLAPRPLIKKFAKVIECAVEIRFGARGLLILKKCLLASSGAEMSFAQVGRLLGVTRERVRVIFNSIVNMLRGIVREDDYRSCEFRIHPQFLRPLRELSSAIARHAQEATMSCAQWDSELTKLRGVTSSELGSVEPLILEILGLQKLVFGQATLRPVISKGRRNKERLAKLLRHVERLLTRDFAHGLTAEQIGDALRRKFGPNAPTAAEVPILVCSIGIAEEVGGRYQARTSTLANPADHYERLLEKAGKPMHYREIASRARRKGYKVAFINGRAVTITMIRDPRFVPIARSGFWALASWPNIETRTIPDLASDLLRESGRPLHQDDLYAMMSSRRRLKRESVATLLSRDKRFRMVAPRVWALRQSAARHLDATRKKQACKTVRRANLRRPITESINLE